VKYRRLHIFVEGPDDRRFFEEIVVPKLKNKYDRVDIREYSREPPEKIEKEIESIKENGWDYIFISDINNSPCITHKKEKIKKTIKNIDEEKIVVVIKEIESWYLAGLGENEAEKWKISIAKISTTNNLTKEDFNRLIPNEFKGSGKAFKMAILKRFSIEKAKERNKSFKYFIEKFVKENE
jgi:hypothetical protein